MELRDYIAVVRRYLVLLAALVVAGAVLGVVVTSQQEARYAATTRLLLLPDDMASGLDGTRQLSGVDQDRYVAGQIEVMRSAAVVRAALGDVGESGVVSLQRNLTITQQGETNIVEVRIEDADPERAAVLTNALSNAYIETRRSQSVAAFQSVADVLEPQIDVVASEIDELDAQIGAADDETILDTLIAERVALSQRLSELTSQRDRLQLAASLQGGAVTVVDEAVVPRHPFAPSRTANVAIGMFLALTIGISYVFIREQLDDRIRSDDDVERSTGLRVLGRLPSAPRSARSGSAIATLEQPGSALSENVRALRTSLAFMSGGRPQHQLVVTSASPGEGKTFVAANLATSFAQTGTRTLLVSADLRHPRIDEVFGVDHGAFGLTDLVLSAMERPAYQGGAAEALRRELDRAQCPTPLASLWFLPSGRKTLTPAELLASDESTRVLDLLAKTFEVVVFDSPPVNAVTDATVLGSRADATLVVARMRRTRRGSLTRAVETLAMANVTVAGVVLNMARRDKGGESKYYTSNASAPVSADLRRAERTLTRPSPEGTGTQDASWS